MAASQRERKEHDTRGKRLKDIQQTPGTRRKEKKNTKEIQKTRT